MPPLPTNSNRWVVKPGGRASPPPPPLAPRRNRFCGRFHHRLRLRPRPPGKKYFHGDRENPAMSPFLRFCNGSRPTPGRRRPGRQQASSDHAPTPADATDDGTGAVSHTPAGAPAGSEDPYWLPPLIDSADFGPTPVSGSAAIYSTRSANLALPCAVWLILHRLRPGELSFARAGLRPSSRAAADSGSSNAGLDQRSRGSFREQASVAFRFRPCLTSRKRALCLSVSIPAPNTTTISWPFPICGNW